MADATTTLPTPAQAVEPTSLPAPPQPASSFGPWSFPLSARIVGYVALGAFLAWLGGLIRDQTFFLGEPHYFIGLPFALLAVYVACSVVRQPRYVAGYTTLHGFVALVCLGFVGFMRIRAADPNLLPVASEWVSYLLAAFAVGVVAFPIIGLMCFAGCKYIRDLGGAMLLTIALLVMIAAFAPCM